MSPSDTPGTPEQVTGSSHEVLAKLAAWLCADALASRLRHERAFDAALRSELRARGERLPVARRPKRADAPCQTVGPLTPNEATIIEYLRTRGDVLTTIEALADELSEKMGGKTCGKAARELVRRGILERPRGARAGVVLSRAAHNGNARPQNAD